MTRSIQELALELKQYAPRWGKRIANETIETLLTPCDELDIEFVPVCVVGEFHGWDPWFCRGDKYGGCDKCKGCSYDLCVAVKLEDPERLREELEKFLNHAPNCPLMGGN